MIVCQFNLSSTQIQILVAFRLAPDTASVPHHPMHDVDHSLSTMRKLTKDGYLTWHEGDRAKGVNPGYRITSKGEMMLRVIEDELRRNLEWFAAAPVPQSSIQGAQHDLAVGKSEINAKGKIRRKKAS